MNLPKFLTTVTSFSKILAAVIFIALPFAGFYLGYKYQQQFTQYLESRASVDQYILKNQPAATQSASIASPAPNGDRANWKTYRNETIGFEFKYPAPWQIIEDNKIKDSNNLLTLYSKDESGETSAEEIKLFIYNNPENLSLEHYDKKHTGNSGIGPGLYDSSDELINLSSNIQSYYRKDGYCVSVCQKYFISRKDKIYEFVGYFSSKSKLNQTFNQILSTFQFTNQ